MLCGCPAICAPAICKKVQVQEGSLLRELRASAPPRESLLRSQGVQLLTILPCSVSPEHSRPRGLRTPLDVGCPVIRRIRIPTRGADEVDWNGNLLFVLSEIDALLGVQQRVPDPTVYSKPLAKITLALSLRTKASKVPPLKVESGPTTVVKLVWVDPVAPTT